MMRLARRNIAISVLIVTALVITALAVLRRPMETLTTECLETARAKWDRARIKDYDMTYEMAGGTYVARVRDGRIVSLTRDGQPTTSQRPEDYTVDGLFEILALELENLNDPRNPFGGDSQTTLLRVRFDPHHGYLQRYLRALGGTGRSHGIELLKFTPSPEAPG